MRPVMRPPRLTVLNHIFIHVASGERHQTVIRRFGAKFTRATMALYAGGLALAWIWR